MDVYRVGDACKTRGLPAKLGPSNIMRVRFRSQSLTKSQVS